MKQTFSLLLTIFIMLTAVQFVYSQPNNKYVSGSVVAAPNAAALGAYSDIPVSQHTGIPSIDIPIHTIEEGSVSLPVSLNYHASGTRVAEMASWAGMGWSLNAGGIITRTVQGIPDETFPSGYYESGSSIPLETDPTFGYYLQDCNLGYKDSEPDLFSFNVAGISGKFFIDHKNATAQGKPAYQFIPRQDLKLEFATDFTKFTIIATDGTRYVFGQDVVNGTTVNAREFTKQFNEPASKKYCSSWYLLKIESADGNYAINLTYQDEYYAYKNLSPCSWTGIMQACAYPYTNATSTQYDECSGASIDPNHYYFTTEIEGKRLSTIASSTSTITFKAQNLRTDLDAHNQFTFNAKSLDTIDIRSGSPLITCKQFVLSYDYFSDPAKPNETYGKRLRLTNVREKSCDGSIVLPAYTFNYNGTFLPYRLSKATDHWGYYNGAANNDNQPVSVPPTTVPYVWSNTQSISFGTANKESNETEMKKGILTDITYPTGSKTYFTFEGNTVYTNLIPTTNDKLTLQSCQNTPPYCCGTQTKTSSNVAFIAAEVPLPSSVPNTSLYPTRFKVQLWPIRTNNGGTSTPCNNATSVSGTVQAFKASNNTAMGQPYSFNIDATLPTGFIEAPLTELGGSQNFEAGNYYFVFTTVDAYGTLTIKSTPATYENRLVGGLRIKEIRISTTQSQTTNDIIKTYEYRQPNSTLSSGVLYRKPVYGWAVSGLYPTSTGASSQMNRIWFSENSVTPLVNFDGGHYGYAEVKELFNGNGHQIHKFTLGYVNNNYSIGFGNAYPIPPVQYEVMKGQKLREETYNATNALVGEKIYEGSGMTVLFSARTVYKVVGFPYTCTDPYSSSQPPGTLPFTIHGYVGYKLWTSGYRVNREIDMLDGVRDTTEYSYDVGNRFVTFPVTIQKRNSDNKLSLTEMKYPHDLPAGCFKDFLLQKNIINTPWKTVEKVGNVQVGGSEVAYASFVAGSGALNSTTSCGAGTFVRPHKFYAFEMTYVGSSPSTYGNDLRGTIDSYNAKGLPASFTAANWLAETYTWNNAGNLLTKTYNGYVTEYNYYNNTNLLSKIKQPDGQEAWYDYDNLNRLVKIWQRPTTSNSKNTANVTTTYEYRHKTQTLPTNPYGENFVRSTTAFATAPSGGGTSTLTSKENIQFMDGLARIYQTVNRKQSPAQKDVIIAVEYDKWAREIKQFNPVESTLNTGAPITVPVSTPFALAEYFADPFNRTWKTTPPSWYATTVAYGANTANEVRLNHTTNTFYSANTLTKTSVTDPDNKVVITYKDKKGRTLLVRRTNTANTGPADTYYIYDDKDRQTKVIPPGSTFSSTTLNFDYTYDQSDNMLTKKVPDAAQVSMKYNTRDQLALAQDGNQLSLSKWMCTQYDDFGRVIKSGLFSGTVPASIPTTLAPTDLYTEVQYGTSGIQLGKAIKNKAKAFDTGGTWLETNMTYDTYGRLSGTTANNYLLPTDLNAETTTILYDFADNVLKDTRVSKKNASVSNTLTQTHNYDHWGRNTLNTHQVGSGTVQTISQLNYNWKDQLIERNIGKIPSATNYLQSLDYAYNNQGWMTSINGSSLGGTAVGFPICPTVQGMPNPGIASTTTDQNDLFYLELKYDQLQANISGTTNKNGNISQVIWRTRGRERQAYSLTYDYLNRMTAARYDNLNDAGTAVNNTNAWNENLTYDIRGNINTLTRTGKYKTTPTATCWTDGQIDNLAYTYNTNTNRLQKIADTAPTASKAQGWNNTAGAATTAQYAYDVNGNMTTDPYKGMAVTYNFLNLPTKFTFAGNKVIDVLYDGGGQKLRKTVTDNGTVQYVQDYAGGIEYRTTSTVALSLESIYHAEGRVFNTNTGTTSADALRYEYAIRDHLGNTRLTFTDKNNNGRIDITTTASTNEVLQENHYYPFGMAMNGPWMDDAARNNQYLYNGKELNDDFGLGLYDYGARWYDPSLGRWWSVDPLSDSMVTWSPYNYVYDRPVNLIDIKGLFPGPGDKFKSADAAALDWVHTYSPNSIAENREYSSAIYSIKDDNGKTHYSYTPAVAGSEAMTPDVEKVPDGTTRVADIHSHAAYDKKYNSNNFSQQDKQDNVADKEVGYVSTPNGSLLKHDSKTGAVTTIGTTLPDSNDPTSPKPPKLEVPSQVTGN